MNTRRQRRIADLLHREISELLEKRVNDPRLQGITVTGVEMTADLRLARIYVTSLGTAEEQRAMLLALRHAGGFLRREIGERVDLRYVPEITFFLDNSWQRGARIDELLKEIQHAETENSEAIQKGLNDEEDN